MNNNKYLKIIIISLLCAITGGVLIEFDIMVVGIIMISIGVLLFSTADIIKENL